MDGPNSFGVHLVKPFLFTAQLLRKTNLADIFSDSRSGTIAHKNKKRITAVTHLFVFQWVSCTLFNLIVQTFLATKSFAVGSSTDPCYLACISKSVPRDVISLIGCSTQLPKNAVGVMHVSWG
jgi:hypothetical protein